jgi:N-acetylglucosaminyldiphosphoundecaprenol N-acetyl-beta-D-mannosaminyltransferase
VATQSDVGYQPGPTVRLAAMDFDRVTEAEAVDRIVTAAERGEGGWVVTPNVDICRLARRDPAVRALLAGAALTVADGMPLVWASRVAGDRLPERVAGGSLIYSLTEAAARHQQPVYFLGGAPGVAEQAAAKLSARYPGLIVAGTDAPPVGFESDPAQIAAIRARLTAARPALVWVGMGCPKQEKLIVQLTPALPGTWFVGCGAAIAYAAQVLPRAPYWMRQAGLSWLFRLLSEPRRLFRRYLINDAPFALRLLSGVALARLTGRRPSR